jgi:ABC-type transport system substrate-binding protein
MNTRLVHSMLAAIVVSAIALALSAGPAEALSVVSKTGTPGAVDVATYVSATNLFPYTPTFVFGSTTVRRSAGYAGTQVATVTYRVFNKQATGWALSRWNERSVTLDPGFLGTFSANEFSSLFEYNSYGADIKIVWKTLSGAIIGSEVVDYNALSDYRCRVNDTFTKCAVYDNGDGLGAYVAFWYTF